MPGENSVLIRINCADVLICISCADLLVAARALAGASAWSIGLGAELVIVHGVALQSAVVAAGALFAARIGRHRGMQ